MDELCVKKKEEMFIRKTTAKITKTQVGGICEYTGKKTTDFILS